MALVTVVIHALLCAICLASGPQLVYDPEHGRLDVKGMRRRTLSVFWDGVVQDLVVTDKKGPTVAAFSYAVIHSAIFDAWYKTQYYSVRTGRSKKCSTQRLAVAYAAHKSLLLLFPSRAYRARRALNQALRGCPRRNRRAKYIGKYVAIRSFRTRNRFVLPKIPIYPWRSSIERWRPERVPIDSESGRLQSFLTKEWGRRRTFGIRSGRAVSVPKPIPFLVVPGELDMKKAIISLDGGANVEVSKEAVGRIINPEYLAQAIRVVNASRDLTPKQRLSAEFWEQGPGTSAPPGAWLKIAAFISTRDRNDAAGDVKLFFALANALNDAGIATWYTKRLFNYARPVRAIRDLGQLRLLDNITFYDVSKSKLVTAPATQSVTYQHPTGDPSPPFPDYVSGHSCFSASAAKVLRSWTGNDQLGATVTLAPKRARFEGGRRPLMPVTLHFKTFKEAADSAAASRIFGGIHFDDANNFGLDLGSVIGEAAFKRARRRWNIRELRLHF